MVRIERQLAFVPAAQSLSEFGMGRRLALTRCVGALLHCEAERLSMDAQLAQGSRDGLEGIFEQQKTSRPCDLEVSMKPLAVTYSHMA